MQFSDLLAELLPSVEKRRHDLGKIRHAFDKFSDPFLEFDHAGGSNLEPEVAQQTADVVLDGDSFLLQQLARRQQSTPFLACQHLHMHGPEKVDAHHLRDAARVIPIALVYLSLEDRLRDRGPASSPMRSIRQAGSLSTRTRSCGWLGTFTSRQTVPASSMMHTEVSLTETSKPA